MQTIWVIVTLLLMLIVPPWVSRSSSGLGEASPKALSHSSISFFSSQVQEPSIKPLVELTVCPEGPPACQFSTIHEAIEAAPETPPVTNWQSPPEIPLVHIAPGLYIERLAILKNVWLKGADHDAVILRSPEEGQNHVTVFIAGPHYLAVILQNLTIEGEVKVAGSVGGVFLNNLLRPDPTGISGVSLMGELALDIRGNVFLDTPISLYPVAPLFPLESQSSVTLLFNQFVQGQRKTAIYVQQSSHVSINSNSIQGFSEGVFLLGAEEIKIIANTFEGNIVGVRSCCSDNVEIRMNKFEDHSNAALQLSTSSRGRYLIAENQITSNNKGIEWGQLAQMQVISNAITQNEVGLQLWPFIVSQDAAKSLENLKECRNNRIFENKMNYIIVGISSEPLRQRCEGE